MKRNRTLITVLMIAFIGVPTVFAAGAQGADENIAGDTPGASTAD